jgi:DNA-binding CsgD family transcriptional regulator
MASALEAPAARVIGRESELATIRDFIERIGAGRVSLVLYGAAGIGKTTLWRAGVRAAKERSYHVLSCRPAELESRLAFGAVIDLLAGVEDEVLESLPAPQRHALAVALLRRETTANTPVQPREVAVGTLSAIRALARSAPVLIAIDDLQWLDTASARVVAYTVRRLEDERVGLLLTWREGTTFPFRVEQLRPDEEITRIEIPPFTLGALHHLVRERLDIGLPRPALARLLRTTGGNPFFAIEILRSLGGELPGTSAELPIPASLRELVAERLAGLPPAAREAVLATFGLSRPTPTAIESALRAARRSQHGLAAALDAEALELRDGRVQLGHPLIGSTLYDELTPSKRRALHTRLAEITNDREEQARHLALAASKPDAKVGDLLEDAARHARSRGAPDSAAELLELAVSLTPNDLGDARSRREFALAQDQFMIGDQERARAIWRRLANEAPPGPLRAEALWSLAEFMETRPEVSEPLLTQAILEADGDLALQARIEITSARVAWWAGRYAAAEQHAAVAVKLAEKTGDPAVLAPALSQAAVVARYRGRAEWQQLIDRAVTVERRIENPPPLPRLPTMDRALIYQALGDHIDLARAYAHEVRELALQRGDDWAIASIVAPLCELECREGNLETATQLLKQGREWMRRAEAWQLVPSYTHAAALIDAFAGRVDEARTQAREALAASMDLAPIRSRCAWLLGFLALIEGNPGEALGHLQPDVLGRAAEGYVGVSPVEPDFIDALVLLGRLDDAERSLSSFVERATRLGRQWALATGERCRGVLLAAQGRIDEAAEALQRAVLANEELGHRVELGRALIAQGIVARRAKRKRDADEALARALDLFERAGIELFAARARAERARIGLRPHAPSELTETEQRVSELAAAGRRNVEIAAELFLSVRAVEANLTRAYRKLGIRSRTELARRLAQAHAK